MAGVCVKASGKWLVPGKGKCKDQENDNHMTQRAERTPNDQNHYEVTRVDLPLHCPMPGMSLWDSHPRVFLPIEESGKAKCPYCGAEYTLRE